MNFSSKKYRASGAVGVIRRRRARRQGQAAARLQGLASLVGLGLTLGIVGGLLVVIGGGALVISVYLRYARELPPPAQITQVRDQFETTLIYDRAGQTVLYQVLDPSGDRQSVPLSQIPRDLINATIAIEDKSFYSNPGFDLRGITRAVWIALQDGPIQGASTITQQLVKNTLIAPEERTAVTQDRKIKEIILAAEISRLYSKDQILEWYLNTNFYGNLAYGVNTAAQVYFGKRVQELTLGEAAMLAAIPQNPQLNPIDDPQAARQRQAVVLESMVSAGYITSQQATEAASQTIVIQPPTERYGVIAPHFALYARRQAEQLLNAQGLDGPRLVLGKGLRIYTTLDLDLHYQAECAMRAHVERVAGGDPAAAPNTSDGKPCAAARYLPVPPKLTLGVRRNVTNAATVVIRPTTGEILSMVGSLDYYDQGIDGSFNAALGLRQPGSTFKPFVYVAAFASPNHNYTPAKLMLDIPTTFDQGGTPYTPRNEDGLFHGPVSVREALANSYNIPVVAALGDVTIGQVLRRARQLGLNTLTGSLEQYGLALALGSAEVTLLDLTYAYTPFATLGVAAGLPVSNPRFGFRANDPIAILRIEDQEGNVLWRLDEANRETFGRQNVLSDGLAYLINNILSDNGARLPAFGKGNALEVARPAAAKTGTTNDNRDAWTVGYTPHVTAGVWVGNNNNTSMGDDVTGALAAAPIWHAVIEYLSNRDKLPPDDWARPASVVEIAVCQQSGLLPTPDCPRTRELFIDDPASGANTVPRQQDIYWKRYKINARNGLLATALTPPELLTERVFYDYPPEALSWALGAGKPLPPVEYDAGGTPAQTGAGDLTAPDALARVRGEVEIRGFLSPEQVTGYTLEYGAGINPDRWIAIPGGDPTARGQGLLLGRWDTSGMNGLYTLRLGVTLADQSFQPRTLQVTVDNTAPTAALRAPENGLPDPANPTNPQAFVLSANAGVVRLAADASDEVELSRVEFFWEDQLIATVQPNEASTSPDPTGTTNTLFFAEWRIIKLGTHRFYAVAYDMAGNRRISEALIVTITP
jgi:membrane peptidoglycan carboxypeptidase